MSEPQLRIQIASDLDYNCLVAEIYVGELFLGLVSQDKGAANLELIFANDLSGKRMAVPLDQFKEVLRRAESELIGSV